jgi:hypothetical protein
MITAIDLSKLRNGEYISFLKNFSEIIDLNDADALLVKDEKDALDAENKKIEDLFLIL